MLAHSRMKEGSPQKNANHGGEPLSTGIFKQFALRPVMLRTSRRVIVVLLEESDLDVHALKGVSENGGCDMGPGFAALL